jgi:uncharacterized protein YeaO (DUF488 family)
VRAIVIKRAYEGPSPDDADRGLVDRIRPRGVTSDALQVDEWPDEHAPTSALRRRFGHDPARCQESRRRRLEELRSDVATDLPARPSTWARASPVTLVYSARDTAHHQARVLAEALAGMATT